VRRVESPKERRSNNSSMACRIWAPLPRRNFSILQAIKAAGALDADLEVI